jgi:hypothetical protein
MERTTLPMGREGSETSCGDWRERATRGGHFMSHTALSALLASKNPLLSLALSMALHRESERDWKW